MMTLFFIIIMMIKRQTCTGHAVGHSPNLCGLTPNPSPEGRGMVCFKG
jgi:hypothetical protein